MQRLPWLGRMRFRLTFGLALFGPELGAQTDAIEGTARDKTGSLIPNATVQTLMPESGERRSLLTTLEGAYSVPNLHPGSYEVFATSPGFKSAHEKNIEVDLDGTVHIDLTLEIGASSGSVEVTATSPVLNTGNATKGEVTIAYKIVEMPLNGRDFSDLALLIPGVAPVAETTRLHTGQPFTPKVTNVNLTLGEANRPNRVAIFSTAGNAERKPESL